MKRIAVITGLIFILASTGCSSVGRTEEPSAKASDAKPPIILERKTNRPLPEGWSCDIEITHEGSRSEGSISRLFYRYTELPPVFSLVIISNSLFEYRTMINIWDNWGYIKSELKAPVPEASEESISSAELKRGWYESRRDCIKTGTPGDWIYAESDKICIRMSPDKIDNLVKYYNLNPQDTPGIILHKKL